MQFEGMFEMKGNLSFRVKTETDSHTFVTRITCKVNAHIAEVDEPNEFFIQFDEFKITEVIPLMVHGKPTNVLDDIIDFNFYRGNIVHELKQFIAYNFNFSNIGIDIVLKVDKQEYYHIWKLCIAAHKVAALKQVAK